MSAPRYKIEDETATELTVRHPDGTLTLIAKGGIGSKLLAKLRAEGEVEGKADGGEVGEMYPEAQVPERPKGAGFLQPGAPLFNLLSPVEAPPPPVPAKRFVPETA